MRQSARRTAETYLRAAACEKFCGLYNMEISPNVDGPFLTVSTPIASLFSCRSQISVFVYLNATVFSLFIFLFATARICFTRENHEHRRADYQRLGLRRFLESPTLTQNLAKLELMTWPDPRCNHYPGLYELRLHHSGPMSPPSASPILRSISLTVPSFLQADIVGANRRSCQDLIQTTKKKLVERCTKIHSCYFRSDLMFNRMGNSN